MTEEQSPVRLSHRLQALAAEAAFALIGLLPIDMASAIGGWVGRTFGPRVGKSRTARKNIQRAMPELSAHEIDEIVVGMWDNLGRNVFEFPHLAKVRADGPDPRLTILGREHLEQLRDDGLPGLFVSAHIGNWETGSLAAAEVRLPMHLFYRAPNNPMMEHLFSRRQATEGELLKKGTRGARRALKLLSEGEHIGILVDQKMNDGIPVPFFGHDSMTAPAVAQFALRYDCPMVMVRIERTGGCRFKITIEPPMTVDRTGDTDVDVVRIMTDINQRLEDWIRERPAQWFWVHRRWPDS